MISSRRRRRLMNDWATYLVAGGQEFEGGRSLPSPDPNVHTLGSAAPTSGGSGAAFVRWRRIAPNRLVLLDEAGANLERQLTTALAEVYPRNTRGHRRSRPRRSSNSPGR